MIRYASCPSCSETTLVTEEYWRDILSDLGYIVQYYECENRDCECDAFALLYEPKRAETDSLDGSEIIENAAGQFGTEGYRCPSCNLWCWGPSDVYEPTDGISPIALEFIHPDSTACSVRVLRIELEPTKAVVAEFGRSHAGELGSLVATDWVRYDAWLAGDGPSLAEFEERARANPGGPEDRELMSYQRLRKGLQCDFEKLAPHERRQESTLDEPLEPTDSVVTCTLDEIPFP